MDTPLTLILAGTFTYGVDKDIVWLSVPHGPTHIDCFAGKYEEFATLLSPLTSLQFQIV